MTGRKTGGPAFPHVHPHDVAFGMTLRDYIATKMAAALAVHNLTMDQSDRDPTERLAKWAYNIADAMIAERNRE